MSGALEGICASIGCAPLRSSLIESADFVLVDVGLLLDARRVVALHLLEIERRLVPQQCAAGALRGFQVRVFFLQFVDELGDLGLVVVMLFAEHGRYDNSRKQPLFYLVFAPIGRLRWPDDSGKLTAVSFCG